MTNLTGKAQTVLGLVDTSDLGITLAHEHLLSDFTCIFEEPAEASQKALSRETITLQNRGWINYNWTKNRDNVLLLNETVTTDELRHFAHAGGRTVVDATNIGIGRDPGGLARIARATGLHILMGSGHYLGVTHPPDVRSRDADSIAEQIVRDITEGADGTGIKAGFIGEIGCSYPMTDEERKCLSGAISAQRATGAALMVHPGRSPNSPVEIVEHISRESGDLSRTIICHIDRTSLDRKWLQDLAATGCYLEFDLFGNESSYYPPNPSVDMPSDAQRMDTLIWHIEQGHGSQILLSHDIATKNRLRAYGGLGYDHLITNLAPRMRHRGISDETIDLFFVKNPARIYCVGRS